MVYIQDYQLKDLPFLVLGHFLFLSCGVMYNPERSPVTERDLYLDEGIFKNYFGHERPL